ncbi:MAG: hypothetical protein CMK96_06235 [Pseudomonas sp.]|nr:hypothetical protein [Pseudomonas sp.]QDP67220.1 MAG: hypothetical protein GOVbin7368_11 [Prokaryotic dsDNA virus sp.]|tara:strand:- start:33782 stop:34045 length:264 start_codon:yes stop_codon:yes gene_type:complete
MTMKTYSLDVIEAASRVAQIFADGCDRCDRDDLEKLETAGLMNVGVCSDSFCQDSLEEGETMWVFNADGEALIAAMRGESNNPRSHQ